MSEKLDKIWNGSDWVNVDPDAAKKNEERLAKIKEAQETIAAAQKTLDDLTGVTWEKDKGNLLDQLKTTIAALEEKIADLSSK